MGILFVLIFYGIALTVAASVGAVAFGVTSYYLTKRSGPERKRAILASIIFPFACEVFAGGWFVAYTITNYVVFHRDPGLGDSWETPLPNGYALMMIDTTDQGTVYNPKTQPIDGGIVSTNDSEFGVRQLQVSKELIFGASDSGYFSRIGQESNVVDTYFELNASKDTRTEFKSLNELGSEPPAKAFRSICANSTRSTRITVSPGSTIRQVWSCFLPQRQHLFYWRDGSGS